MSWADMAQEDELEAEEENEDTSRQMGNGNDVAKEGITVKEVKPKTQPSKEQREYIRFTNVKRKKDFICLERVKGKIVNILDGLELHTGVFSAAEQKRIVDYMEVLQEMGKKGELKERTFSTQQKWIGAKVVRLSNLVAVTTMQWIEKVIPRVSSRMKPLILYLISLRS